MSYGPHAPRLTIRLKCAISKDIRWIRGFLVFNAQLSLSISRVALSLSHRWLVEGTVCSPQVGTGLGSSPSVGFSRRGLVEERKSNMFVGASTNDLDWPGRRGSEIQYSVVQRWVSRSSSGPRTIRSGKGGAGSKEGRQGGAPCALAHC